MKPDYDKFNKRWDDLFKRYDGIKTSSDLRKLYDGTAEKQKDKKDNKNQNFDDIFGL